MPREQLPTQSLFEKGPPKLDVERSSAAQFVFLNPWHIDCRGRLFTLTEGPPLRQGDRSMLHIQDSKDVESPAMVHQGDAIALCWKRGRVIKAAAYSLLVTNELDHPRADHRLSRIPTITPLAMTRLP